MHEHAHDILKVLTFNLSALVVSVASVEPYIRIAAPTLACIYTLMKIYALICDWKKE